GSNFLFYSVKNIAGSSSNVINDLLKYNAPREPGLAIFGIDYFTKEVRVANGNYRNLNFSVLSYFIKRSSNNGSSQQSSYLFNEFNENIISKLKANDTLAIQEYTLNAIAR